ncbi:membrane anchor in succinate dehydrogenase complex [Turnera subulata]|uniref:Membrane anchor in succinate dehydrogenase complex n=1 Tax=Turnera subulata TaxID=218843 RepID=A0A9Q0JPV1_9ROSI|nr:membrane anchor in succinate dehydrogenase complex [Turnera subulata]
MEKMAVLRTILRSACSRSPRFAAIAGPHHSASRSLFTLSSSPSLSPSPTKRIPFSDLRSPLGMGLGSRRSYSEDVTHYPAIKDPEILRAFKDLMATSWDDLPNAVISEAKKAVSKTTDDKAGQEALRNVFRAAEAVEEFSGRLISLKMELDDSIGMSGENVKPLSDDFADALRTAFERYTVYLASFGPDEGYLRKKVETELGSRMIFLKMRCSGLDSAWGKVTVLGTSGLAGSYVEQRA